MNSNVISMLSLLTSVIKNRCQRLSAECIVAQRQQEISEPAMFIEREVHR